MPERIVIEGEERIECIREALSSAMGHWHLIATDPAESAMKRSYAARHAEFAEKAYECFRECFRQSRKEEP